MENRLTSTSHTESAVINAPLPSIWRLIQLHEFGRFYTGLNGCESTISDDGERDVVKWTFTDGTVLHVRLEEYSVRSDGT